MNPHLRAFELKSLLSGWRARLRPQDVGLPMTIRRRVPGLRREEVAELVGVSPNWYALFESGAADRRFSAAFVQHVAEALRLDERERATLFRLALPEIRFAVEQLERSAHDGAVRDLQAIRTLVRRVSAAADFAEAAGAAADAVLDMLSPTSVASAILAPNEDFGQIISTGARAHFHVTYSAIVNTCIPANYPTRYGHTTYSTQRASYRETKKGSFSFEQRTVEGPSFFVKVADPAPPSRDVLGKGGCFSDVAVSAVKYWDWNSRLSIRSAISHGLFAEGAYRGNLCALWTEPRSMSALDAEILRIASAIVELVAAPAARGEQRAVR